MKLFKYNLIALTVLSLALFASCKKDNPSSGGTLDGMGFMATTEQDGGNSKTYLDDLENGRRKVLWSVNDQIKVANYDGSGSYETLTYELTEGAGNTNGVFYTGQNHDDFFHPNYVAAYPAAYVSGISGKSVTFNLPSTQSMGTNSFGNGCNPMVAYSDSQTLPFKNVCGVLCFPLEGTNHVSRVVLTSTTPLWGTCTVNAENPDSYTLSGGGNSITLNCDVTLSSTATDFYFVLPPGNLPVGYTLEVYDGGVQLYSRNSEHAATVERSVIKKPSSSIRVPASVVPIPEGVIPAAFTVGMDGSTPRKVYFSKGNLQYIGSAATPYWKFADNQWDWIGGSSNQLSTSESVDRDLFGWGTSGNSHGSIVYQPWSTSTNNTDYWAYGVWSNNLSDGNGQADWGYNAISNGGNATNKWRTLTEDEWNYILNTRTTTSGIRYAKATLTGISRYGLILLPDNWNTSTYALNNTNTSSARYDTNLLTDEDWTTLQNAGAVFLTAAGYREGTTNYGGVNTDGYYWSSTHGQYNTWAKFLSFDGSKVKLDDSARSPGRSVRLVRSYN